MILACPNVGQAQSAVCYVQVKATPLGQLSIGAATLHRSMRRDCIVLSLGGWVQF